MAKLYKCIFCGCIMAECITEEEAIEVFNNRVTEADIRAKAIEEFAEKIKSNFVFTDYAEAMCFKDKIEELAEQLKGEK